MTSAAIARAVVLAGVAVSYGSCVQAALYKCTTADGKVAYQDAPCPSSASEQALKAKAPPPAPAKAAAGGKPAPKPSHDAATSAKPPQTVDVNVRTDRDRKPAADAPTQPYPSTPK
jgi:hypothetical protein